MNLLGKIAGAVWGVAVFAVVLLVVLVLLGWRGIDY